MSVSFYNFGFLLELKYQVKAFKIWLQAFPKTFRNFLYDQKKKRERKRKKSKVKTNTEKKLQLILQVDD